MLSPNRCFIARARRLFCRPIQVVADCVAQFLCRFQESQTPPGISSPSQWFSGFSRNLAGRSYFVFPKQYFGVAPITSPHPPPTGTVVDFGFHPAYFLQHCGCMYVIPLSYLAVFFSPFGNYLQYPGSQRAFGHLFCSSSVNLCVAAQVSFRPLMFLLISPVKSAISLLFHVLRILVICFRIVCSILVRLTSLHIGPLRKISSHFS